MDQKKYYTVDEAAQILGITPADVNQKRERNELRGFRDGAVEIDVDGTLHRVPHDRIAKAHLEYDFEADLRRKE